MKDMTSTSVYRTIPSTPIRKMTIKDPGSSITHFIGLIMAALGTAPLLVRAGRHDSPIYMISMAVFMASMILLYAASTTYHTFDVSPSVNKLLKKVDHMMISVLIAGSYTPVCLLVLNDRLGLILLGIVWGTGNHWHSDQSFLDLLSKMVFFYIIHWHGMDLRSGFRADRTLSDTWCILLVADRRHYLHHWRCDLCTEAADF